MRVKKKTFKFKFSYPRLQGPRWAWVRLIFGWGLAVLGILGLLNYHPVLKTEQDLTTSYWLIWPPLAAGFILVVQGFRRLPFRRIPDLDRKKAWIGLGLILASGAILRLYRLGEPPGLFWDDWATTLVWVHNILDKNKFFWMMPSDGIEPFNPYVITALRALVPDGVSDIVVRRIASCLIDMLALWVLYLAGKEMGSRRTGLVAATLGALGRPMVQLTVTGMRAYTLSLSVGFLILASLKLFRKPSLGHFLLWSLALAFGIHTYSSFRVYLLLLPFFILPWILKEWKRAHPLAWVGAVGSVFLLMGVLSGTFAVTDPRFTEWSRQWDEWMARPGIAACFFLASLGPSYFSCYLSYRQGRIDRLAGWSLAVGLASLLIFPLTLSSEFNGRMGVLSPFRNEDASRDIPGFLVGQIWQTVRSLFYFCKDRHDLMIGTEPFYDLFSQGALLLGFAFCLTRPDWKKGFLLLVGGLGMVVYVISFDPASTKLAGSAPAFYLLAGLAVQRLWEALPSSPRKAGIGAGAILLSAVLGAYAVWGFWMQKSKIFDAWARFPGMDTQLSRILAQEEPRNRVYLAPSDWFFGWSAQFVLNEGRKFYILKDINCIPVRNGETPQDIEILIYGSNQTLIQTLHQQYPRTVWIQQYVFPHVDGDPNPELYIWRVLIKGRDIPSDPKYLVYCQEQNGLWLRRYYNSLYGWGLSGILKEERADYFSASIDEGRLTSKLFERFAYARLVQFRGPLVVGKSGESEWSIRFPGPLWIMIDGKTIWKKDISTQQEKFHFKAYVDQGAHEMEIRARFPERYEMPEIEWRENGAVAETEL